MHPHYWHLVQLLLLLEWNSVICMPLVSNGDAAVRFVAPYESMVEPVLQHKLFTSSSRIEQDAKRYLVEFGYLNVNDKLGFKNALLKFQQFAEIPQTGELDATTLALMRRPRCGNRDIEDVASELPNPLDRSSANNLFPSRRRRTKRYSIEGSYWGVKDITYRIGKYTSEMDKNEVDNIIKKSFKVWEQHSPLTFENKESGPVNIEVMFVSRSHGDGEPFDGRGQILAHAFFPRYGGDVHFDNEEPWRALQGRGIDLYSVAAHEIGHSLGLKHSQNHQALMAPFYQGYTGDAITLHADDIKGLQRLYGTGTGMQSGGGGSGLTPTDERRRRPIEPISPVAPTVAPSPIVPVGRRPASSVSAFGDQSDICADPRLDAMTVLGNGTTYVFKGQLYWKLNQLSYESGYPRRIADDWDGLPGDLDAAVTDYDGDTYFFKGEEYWLYNPNGKRYKGYPRRISVGLVDTPSHIDAAMIWSYDDKPYFFKDYRYWQYSRWGMPNSWPRPINDIFSGIRLDEPNDINRGGLNLIDSAALRRQTPAPTDVGNIPERIDAAVKWNNGKTYIFSGHQYYRLTGWRVMKVVAGYPRDVGEWWFGCTPRSRRKRRAAVDYRDK